MRDSQAKLILFNELRRGPLTEVEASLFPVRLRADLIREGVARKRDDGGLELANPTTYTGRTSEPPAAPVTTPPPASVPAHESMTTLTVRVPQEYLDLLDAIGPTRSDALRGILKRATGSGLRKRTAGYVVRERATS
jgi:hypothetical protein